MAQSEADCVFCEIVRGAKPASVVYEDEQILAFMDIHPINPGHLLVIPKHHCIGLSDLSEETGARMFTVAQQLAKALRRSGARCEGINLFLADGAAAGQDVFHCHLHVRPRFTGDSYRVEYDTSTRPTRQELDALAQRITAAYREALP